MNKLLALTSCILAAGCLAACNDTGSDTPEPATVIVTTTQTTQETTTEQPTTTSSTIRSTTAQPQQTPQQQQQQQQYQEPAAQNDTQPTQSLLFTPGMRDTGDTPNPGGEDCVGGAYKCGYGYAEDGHRNPSSGEIQMYHICQDNPGYDPQQCASLQWVGKYI